MASEPPLSGLVPTISRPIQLSPVGLKEAALDSPSFRAATFHFNDQIDAVERWLESYVKAISKLSQEVSVFENLVTAVASSTIPPTSISEAVVDHDYTILAAQRYSDIAKTFWQSAIAGLKKLDMNMVEPIRNFVQTDLRSFKELRRQLENTQRTFDSLSARYASQLKNKEASALREDAFQLHEARRAYLKASLDISIAAPQLRTTLDKVLVKAFHEQGQKMWRSQNPELARWTAELERIRGWSRELETSEKSFRKDMQAARRGIEQTAEAAIRPSRELEDYSQSTTPAVLLAGGQQNALSSSKPKSAEKQGWLYVRTLAGKPPRPLWNRRWFYVKNGIFGCLVQGSRSGGVEESERIGVLLCGIRRASQEERRFCFEVKTKDLTIVLQAESQPEMVEWMSTFDLAKQKALQDPLSTDAFSSSTSSVLDPAFAISKPDAPEFTASAADVAIYPTGEEGYERGSSLAPPTGTDTLSSLQRNSFDVNANRRSTTFDRDGEGGREFERNRDRLMHKLDLARRSPALSGSSPNVQGSGIASLISATHASMPVGPGSLTTQPAEQPAQRIASMPNRTAFLARTLAPNSLAPSTLVNPPNATNLSSMAVSVNGERGIGVGSADSTGGMPSGMLANLWGSTNWGAVNRFERGEVKSTSLSKQTQDSAVSRTPSPRSPNRQSTAGSSDDAATMLNMPDSAQVHRKTVSLDGDVNDLQRIVTPSSPKQEFPSQYPVQLKHQDAQFRLLFPNVDPEEKLILVFRATWVPNEQQEFPGRAYLTPRHIFFYSNHLGLVLVTGFSLDRITEVTAAPGRDCDFLFLHMKGVNESEFARITIKTFLSDLRLLQRRINFILQNHAAGATQDLASIMKTMAKLETEPDPRSPSDDSWEGPFEGDGFQRNPSQRSNKNLRTKLLVDQGLNLEISRHSSKAGGFKFKLPNRPIAYVPKGYEHPVVERIFNISPKALYHVLFGDRSAVWQLAYLEQNAKNLKQGPWLPTEQGNLRREFSYNISASGLLNLGHEEHVVDSQLVDVSSDHLLYVVTDRKTPWHLPFSGRYKLVSKVVITHETKSRSKLAIYTGIEWQARPLTTSGLLERHALSGLHSDATYVMDIAAEQVDKLGVASNTKKAIQIFGAIGQQTKVVEFQDISSQSRRSHPRRVWTIFELLFTAVSNVVANFIASVVALGLSTTRQSWRTINANRVILVILFASVLFNLFLSSAEVYTWRQQHNARWYMRRLGVGRDLVMSKSIHLGDIDDAIHPGDYADTINFGDSGEEATENGGSAACLQSYHDAASAAVQPASAPTSLLHLQRSRQRLGRYRHDLMVAMRVVNNVDTELVRAGWEDWIVGESRRCDDMSRMLDNQPNATFAGDVRPRLDEYCASCRIAGAQLLGGGSIV